MSRPTNKLDRRQFMRVMGAGALASTLGANIAKALAIPANNRTGTIRDVEYIVILMQENRPFDHQFGTLRGVRGFSDPRAANIQLPLASGTGTTPASVFLQPAGAANVAAGYGVPPNSGDLGGPANGAYVIPPFHINPGSISAGLETLGLTYFPGTNHGWQHTHECWNLGQHDSWPSVNGPMVMSYLTREDIPYHYALADAFTVGDDYHSAIMGPTNPNRTYLFTGCVGNLDGLGSGGTDGQGAGPMTGNGLSPNNAYWTFPTFPERLQAAGITWKVYQDLAGSTFNPDFGDGTSNSFAGNYTDNPVLYFNQYATAAPGSPLYENACTGTEIINTIPASGAPEADWLAWQQQLFAQFRSDVQNGTLPQVSWFIGPAGYSEHPDYPVDYGAWYISQILDILVANPEVFSKTVFLIDYDEADGSFDHMPPPFAPPSPAYGASTADFHNEIVTTATPPGPIGLNCRVGFLAVSPWSKGGYVVSQVFDHTSVIQFIEKRFGVFEPNISPWRRAVAGDLTTVFNFSNPNDGGVELPSTDDFLPSVNELSGGNVNTFVPTQSDVTVGLPLQEKGVRPSRALPYELNAYGSVNLASGTFAIDFLNTGSVGAVFQVRSGNPADNVRAYTVEAGKSLSGTWSVGATYDLSVYAPNGFTRYFKGSTGAGAAALEVREWYDTNGRGSIGWGITNVGTANATVSVLDAYSGYVTSRTLEPGQSFEDSWSRDSFFGWYDLVVTVAQDPTFNYRLAGHVETGRDSFSDPALGGFQLKA
jgi:phospholipase C